ncbi:hypothetical protein EOM09_08210 [bacterium]|nr:hypothetical protein [bacterium]
MIIGRNSNIKRIKKIKLQTNHQIFAIFFEVVVDRKEKFLVDKNEVQQVARFSKKKLKKELENTNNIFLKEFFS